MVLTRKARTHSAVSLVSEKLRTMALEKASHEKLPTLSDLCKLLGTSRSTLVEALDELEMQQVVYRHPGKGVFVSPHIQHKTLCILLDSAYLDTGLSSFWGNLWGVCAQVAQNRATTHNESHQFQMLAHTHEQEAKMPAAIIRMIQSQLIHGFISIGLRTHASELLARPVEQPRTVAEVITQSGLPCVTFTSYGRWVVEQDYQHMVSLAIQRLIEQGCRNIGLWHPVTTIGPEEHFELATFFSHILDACKLSFDPALVRTFKPATSGIVASFQEQGYAIATEVFDNPDVPRPDGVVVIDDMLMSGALMAFLQRNITIGETLKIATHANVGSLPFWERIPGVTVIEFDPRDVANALFSMLDTLLDGQVPARNSISIKPRFRPT